MNHCLVNYAESKIVEIIRHSNCDQIFYIFKTYLLGNSRANLYGPSVSSNFNGALRSKDENLVLVNPAPQPSLKIINSVNTFNKEPSCTQYLILDGPSASKTSVKSREGASKTSVKSSQGKYLATLAP